jgi:hypothetical protein
MGYMERYGYRERYGVNVWGRCIGIVLHTSGSVGSLDTVS